MRISTFPTVLSLALFLSSYANAYRYDENEVYAREPHYLDTLSHEISARDLLSELTTRELMDELHRRGNPLSNYCPWQGCNSQFNSPSSLEVHVMYGHGKGTCFKCHRHFDQGGQKHFNECRVHTSHFARTLPVPPFPAQSQPVRPESIPTSHTDIPKRTPTQIDNPHNAALDSNAIQLYTEYDSITLQTSLELHRTIPDLPHPTSHPTSRAKTHINPNRRPTTLSAHLGTNLRLNPIQSKMNMNALSLHYDIRYV
ncbi:hypothetical protein DFP72DRAFT_1048522 [Ephemerocybe angulata]|uniref:C2H2-type domain-containing protein n=1 Tax=Ephemerocybe angulata TaxID=980116 RepID=A0A8H6M1N7_9AGAR|nr:hypothetical protein DFP72DRAFT_1048522 [Tulosesus angulatus]